jgi:hypothetical protein
MRKKLTVKYLEQIYACEDAITRSTKQKIGNYGIKLIREGGE